MLAGSVSPFSAREEWHWAQAVLRQLSDKGHQVDLFTLPVVQDPLLLPEQFMALRLLSVDPGCDLLITVGHPAFVLNHPRKRVLLFSLASPLREWFDSEYGVLATPQYHSIRRSIEAAEKKCLAEAERIVCGSARLTNILGDEYKIKSSAHILDDVYEDRNENDLPAQELWVVTESTLEPCDRVDLLLDSVVLSHGKWKLALFVPSSSAVYHNALLQRLEKLGIQERVFVLNAPLSTKALEKSILCIVLRYKSSRIPECTVRAVKSKTPTLTLSDCGALLEIVRDNVNGWVLKPNARSIAQILDQASADTSLLKKLSEGNRYLLKTITDVGEIVRELTG